MFNMTRHGLSLFRISLYAALVAAIMASAILAAQPARTAEPVRLNPGYVSLLKLDQTISTIVIGNPDIVDATLQGKNAILLTAKKITGSAATNVIVLNSQDAEIFNATIVVGSQGGSKTEIHSKGRRLARRHHAQVIQVIHGMPLARRDALSTVMVNL
jgi:Flp pilus assembly secretin CpaC